MGEKQGCWILPTKHLFHGRKVLLHAINLRHGTDGFTSPPKEVMLRIFIILKNPSSSAGFELVNLVSSGKHATTRPPRMTMEGIYLPSLFIKNVIKLNAVVIKEYHSDQLHTKCYPTFLLSRLTLYIQRITGHHLCGFWHHLPIRHSAFIRYQTKKNGSAVAQYITYL
jgi:hypothetical protein